MREVYQSPESSIIHEVFISPVIVPFYLQLSVHKENGGRTLNNNLIFY